MKKWFSSKFFSLDKKMLAMVLCVNLLFTIASAGVDRFLQRKAADESLEHDLKYIEAVIFPAVANSVWKMDFEQSKVQLQGILTNPSLTRVLIAEGDRSPTPVLEVHKEGNFSNLREKKYDLLSPRDQRKFATITLYMTTDPIVSWIRTETIKHSVSNFIQTLILCLLIFYAFRVLVLNHIGTISTYFRRNSVISHSTPLLSDKVTGVCKDEIDDLIDAINRTVNESKRHQVQIEELKDQADRANRAKSMFLANINHELRTPLTALLGVIDLVPESFAHPEEQKRLLELQKRSGLHLLHLVDEILDLSKIEAGEMRIDMVPMEIRKTLETCRLIMERPVQEKDNRLDFQVDNRVPQWIIGDPDRINQIVLNLVSNANKFTEHGFITIHVSASERDFEINVTDTGIGVPKDKVQEIFLPFRQLEGPPQELSKGTGIGLAITKRLVDLMGGQIKVESQVGIGSSFRVCLPLRIAEPEEVQALSPVRADWTQQRRPNILVVEDTAEVRILIQAYVKKMDVHVAFARNGEEGVSMFKSGDYSMILMDLQMPVMNGYEAVKRIRELEHKADSNRHVPILAMTALTTKNDIDLALRSGFDGYVTKPFSRDKILHALQKHPASCLSGGQLPVS